MPDLTFSSKGTAQVLADQQKLKDGAKAMTALYKEENREIAKLGKDASKIFQQTRTDSEKLRQQAEKLRAVIANTKLPDLDRAKAADALKRVEGKLRDVEGEGKKVDKTLTQAFGESKTALLGRFATVAGTVTAGVAAGIKLVVDELRAAQDLADKAAAAQISVAASRNVVIRNLPGASQDQITKVLRQNAALAGTTGVSETAINQARASALSASGGNVAASLRATEIAARFLPDRPGEIGDFAGSLLDLSKVTGTTNAQANLGLLSAVGGLSRITDQRQQATNIPAALIGARGFGFNTAESAALFSTLTTESGDLTGAQAGTATIQLARQLSEFNGTFDTSGVTDARSALAKARSAAAEASASAKTDAGKARAKKAQAKVVAAERRLQEEQAKQARQIDLSGLSTGEKLRALQSNPELAEVFLSDASFETKQLAPIRGLLTNAAGKEARSFNQNLSQIPGLAGLARRGASSLASFNANTLERRARLSRRLDSLLETELVSGAPADLSTDDIQKIQALLQKAGGSATGSRLLTFFSKFADGSATLSRSEAANAITSRRDALLNPVQAVSGGVGAPGVAVSRPITEAERKQADALDRILKVLEEGNVERKKQTDKLNKPGGIPVTGG